MALLSALVPSLLPVQVRALLTLLLLPAVAAPAATYYLDADGGSDSNAGTSPAAAWASLAKASSWTYQPGDRILLQAGDTFAGKLLLFQQFGAAGAPIEVASYGAGPAPLINASGHIAGVHVRRSGYITVRDLEITADGGAMVDGSPEGYRYGVYVDSPNGGSVNFITIDNLHIHDIYPAVGTASEGANPTTHMGTGVGVDGRDRYASTHITVRRCRIERVGYKAIELRLCSFVEVLDNDMQDIGGPAIQPGRVDDLVVRGNTVDGSGAYTDPRMHGRGSGIWPWSSNRVLIERNRFMRARGRADSCGVHIDFNCRDVVVQYNLSVDNAGGFIEILGNNFNCTYRYNISINDGSRVKGVIDQGTLPNNGDGHVLWISGYVGSGNTPQGPTNSYIYNNTIYVRSDIRTTFSIQDTARGILVANNVFYIEGPSVDITATGADNYTQDMVDRVVWRNNLYQRAGIVPVFFNDSPADPSFTDTDPRYGDPLFASAGGLQPEDYIPQADALIVDQGITIEKLPGDAIGLLAGLPVNVDFFGSPVLGQPDMGAVELGGTPLPLPAAAFSEPPASRDPGSVAMAAVAAPFNTEYYFSEVSGNLGGDDSGWRTDPAYVDDGLLPNTTYAYTVTLRDALDQPGAPSATVVVTTPARVPAEDSLILAEDFSSTPNPANSAAPYPLETWYIAYELQAQDGSVAVTGGQLRLGWGYDRTLVLWQAARTWSLAGAYRFTGDWEIASALDVHQGIIAGIGEFDPATGELLRRVKQATVGDLLAPAAGQGGSFAVEVTAAELAAAGVSGSSRVGVYFEHPGAGTPQRNDVYLVDNLELCLSGTDTDLDGDGIPDLVRPGELFQPLIMSAAGSLEILLPGANVLPGRLYILEHSPDLGAWTAIDAISGQQAGPGSDQLLLPDPPAIRDFFRLRVEWE